MMTGPELASKQILVVFVEPGLDSKLKIKNKNIVYEKDGIIVSQCSLDRVIYLMIVGDISLTTGLIKNVVDFGISACLLKSNLSPYANFGFETQANFVLRERQYQIDDKVSLLLAKNAVSDKIYNQNILLKRVNAADDLLLGYQKNLDKATNPKTLLGIEGSASKVFFQDYFEFYGWVRRRPRIKEDPINFMLDIGYTVLFNFIDALCRHFGLDTYKGFYHTQFFARKSLICDLIEPFRCLVDNRTKTALSLGIVNRSMFKTDASGCFASWQDSSKIVMMYAEDIISHKDEIFKYIHGYYKYIMEQSNNIPTFKLKR